jgi:hypothetical protein
MRFGTNVFAFGLVGAILIAAAHDHALGWGTAVAVVATVHNIWRQIRLERTVPGLPRRSEVAIRVPEPIAKGVSGPLWPEHWPEGWRPTWFGRRAA